MSRNVTGHHIISSHTAVCLRFWKIGQWLNAGLVVSDWRWTQRSGTNWHRLVTPTYRRCKLPERTENHGHGPSEHHREFLSYPRTKASEWVDQLHSPSLPPKCENRSEFEQQIRQRTHTLLAIPKITRRNRKCILTNEMHPFRKGIAIVSIYRLQRHLLSFII